MLWFSSFLLVCIWSNKCKRVFNTQLFGFKNEYEYSFDICPRSITRTEIRYSSVLSITAYKSKWSKNMLRIALASPGAEINGFLCFEYYTRLGQIHTFQKCIQNRPSTLRGWDKQLFLFWPLSVYDGRPIYDEFSTFLEMSENSDYFGSFGKV